jgi:hypothetical protein
MAAISFRVVIRETVSLEAAAYAAGLEPATQHRIDARPDIRDPAICPFADPSSVRRTGTGKLLLLTDRRPVNHRKFL